MNLHIPDTVWILALALLAHGWIPRMTLTARVATAVGWVLNILAMLALAAVWLR